MQHCAMFRNRKNAKGREPKNTGREPGLKGTGSRRFKPPCPPPPPHLNKLSETLKRNSFPSHFIDKTIKNFLRKPKSASISDNGCPSNANNSNTSYFTLPFIGNFSNITQIKIKHLSRHFCNDLDIKLVFSSYKIKNFFSFKDPVPAALVVYQFSCAGCNSRYIGENSGHFSTRIKDHT